jgi:hypothetical protein
MLFLHMLAGFADFIKVNDLSLQDHLHLLFRPYVCFSLDYFHPSLVLLQLFLRDPVHALNVLIEIPFLGEGFPTDKALEGLLTSVDTHVVNYIALLPENPIAVLVTTE